MARKNWTATEVEYLESKWGSVSIPYIAEKLGRSANSIKEKAVRLGLGPVLMGGDYVTLNQLMIAVTGHTVDSYHKISWIQNRKMPVHTKRVNECTFRVVYIDEFWKWAKENRSFIDFSKMEPLSLGQETAWVAQQRKNDYLANGLQRKDPWSSVDDERLIHLLKQQKYGYAELSKMLRRSEGAIQRRCIDLGTKYRPIKADNHGEAAKWTEKHFEVLAEGIRTGASYSSIGERIGKSEKAVRGKVYAVYFTENADKVRSMLQGGEWGNGAPLPTVKQAVAVSSYRRETKEQLSYLAGLLRYRANQLGYDPYWQRFMCVHWDDYDGCLAGEKDCDRCLKFCRIKEQYCARCGKTFFERQEQRFCKECRTAKKKQAQKKWRILSNKRNV